MAGSNSVKKNLLKDFSFREAFGRVLHYNTKAYVHKLLSKSRRVRCDANQLCKVLEAAYSPC